MDVAYDRSEVVRPFSVNPGVTLHDQGVTLAGTMWGEYRYTPSGGTETLVRHPRRDNGLLKRGLPMVLFLHGNEGTETQVLHADTAAMLEMWLDEGYSVLATRAGSSGWGNASERAAYQTAIADAIARFKLNGQLLLYSRSMGGLTGLYLLTTHAGAKGWAGNSPVCDLRAAYDDTQLDQYVEAAYGIPGTGDYDTQTAGHDPMLFDLADYAGKRLRGYAANDDTDVPRDEHVDALMAYVDSVATESEIVTVTGGHVGSDSWRVEDVRDYFGRCLA